MVVKNKVIAVDEKFFINVFEKQRKILQDQLGITNLSQPNFSKMIKGFKVITPKKDISKTKKGRKKNENLFTI